MENKLKKNRKLSFVIVFIFSSFALLTCEYDMPHINRVSPYLGNTLEISGERVWTRNSLAVKISEVYLPYNENYYLSGIEYIDNYPYIAYMGSGDIINGVLNFTVQPDDISAAVLLPWKDNNGDEFKSFFSTYWKDVQIDNEDTMGNLILLLASTDSQHEDQAGMLDRQRIYGTASTITNETILYFYASNDCIITGNQNSGYISGQYYFHTKGNLRLDLKSGWNMVCRKETYGVNFNGNAIISMEIRNPIERPEDFKWVMHLGYAIY